MAGEDPDEDLLDELLEDQEDVDLAAEETGVYADSDEVKVDEKDEIDLEKVNREIERLRNFIVWARSIGVDTKCKTLLNALNIGFEKMSELSAPRKAVIFTESRRTQNFVKKFLDSNGYLGKTVCFNGSNNDSESAEIYQAWLEKNNLNGRSSGSRAIDVRTALIEKFRDDAEILIATEAAAEGVNLQFCALVINYDLPWNPQRIEQRIGRCHRYGQKHDVVVINFLNERNHADRRVLELLEHKFNLFTGVFGASDEILGSIEAGVDFEKRVIEIYQTCRSEEEIGQAFDQLQQELEDQIRKRMIKTRKILLENFDSDVHDRLNVNLEGTREKLDQIGKKFWRLTRHELVNNAVFDEIGLSFELKRAPKPEISTGVYHLISKDTDQKAISGKFLYRMNHLLGEYVLAKGKNHDCQVANLTFKLSDYPGKISVVENLKGKAGWLGLQLLQIDSFANHDYLLFSAFTDDGKTVDSETCQKLFWCDAVVNEVKIDSVVARKLDAEELRYRQATISRNMEENNNYFNEAREQLDKWVHDQELAAQSELDNIKKQIRETTRLSRQATSLDEQYKLQEQIARLEKRKRKMRQKIFDVEDEIAEKRDLLIERLERRMSQKTKHQELFRIRWKVV
jgi:hypothetical protein